MIKIRLNHTNIDKNYISNKKTIWKFTFRILQLKSEAYEIYNELNDDKFDSISLQN